MSPHKWHWVCFSFKQQAIHVETATEGISRNGRAFATRRPVDFVPIAVFDTEADARSFARMAIAVWRKGSNNSISSLADEYERYRS